MSLLQMAVLHMDASATSIIYSGNPVFAVAAAHVILHEPLRKNHLLAIALEVVGILFILNPAHLEISLRGFWRSSRLRCCSPYMARSASCVSVGLAAL